MAVNPTVVVNISLNTTGVSRAGFGTPIFIGAHRWFPERVRVYNSISAAADDLPTDSNEYQAILRAFQQTPSATQVKIARREADMSIIPSNPSVGKVYSMTLEVNDGDNIVATYTADGTDTRETVVDALLAAITGDAAVIAHVTATKVGTGANTTLSLVAPTDGDYFVVKEMTNVGYVFTTTETADDVLAAIENEDQDFYAVAAHDHTETFVLDMADAIEARNKLYFVSSQQASTLSAFSAGSTDVLAKLNLGNYLNTVTFFHHEADTKFPEMAYFGYNAPYDPGKVVWVNIQLNGLPITRNPTTGRPLSLTEQNYLALRNASWIATSRGVDIVRGGKTAKGEWIDVVRGKHFWIARLTEGLETLLYNQQGSKISYNNQGIARVDCMCRSVSDRLLSTEQVPNLLDKYEFNFPRAEELNFSDRQSRVLKGTFRGYLTGAIHEIVIDGVLTYEGL